MLDAEPWGPAASLIYSGLQEEQKVSAVPEELKVTVQETRFIVFPTAPLAPMQERMPASQWQILVVFPSEETYEMVSNCWMPCQDREEHVIPASTAYSFLGFNCSSSC